MGPLTAKDPVGPSFDPNLYGYGQGDPINLIDPSGLKIELYRNEELGKMVDCLRRVAGQAVGSGTGSISHAGLLITTILDALEASKETVAVKFNPYMSGIGAGSTSGNEDGSTIEINPNKYGKQTDAGRAQILAHEFGHAFARLLGLGKGASLDIATLLHNALADIANCGDSRRESHDDIGKPLCSSFLGC